MARSFAALFGCIFIQCLAASHLWTPNGFPNPLKNPDKCGRSGVLHSAICDPDHIMPEAGKNIIEQLIVNASSAELAVVIIRSMDLKYFESGDIDDAARIFAKAVHNNVSPRYISPTH